MRIPFKLFDSIDKDNWHNRKYIHLSSNYLGTIQTFNWESESLPSILFTLVELSTGAIISNKREFSSICEINNWMVRNYNKEISVEGGLNENQKKI